MSDKKVEELIKKMEDENILLEFKTFKDYINDLLKFQSIVTKMILAEEYQEGMRLDDALYMLKRKARDKGLYSEPKYYRALDALKKVEKEIRIRMSGYNAEGLVAKTLEHIEKENAIILRNINLKGENAETEIDALVICESGIILIEIKSVKNDAILDRDGRLVFNGTESYGKKAVAKNIEKKVRILRENLEYELKNRGLNIPISIDSLLVLSVPKNKHIEFKDYYYKQGWCFRTQLVDEINGYFGRIFCSANRIKQLAELISEIGENEKSYDVKLDYNNIRRDIAEFLVLLSEKEKVDETLKLENNFEKSTDNRLNNKVVSINNITKEKIRNSYKKKNMSIIRKKSKENIIKRYIRNYALRRMVSSAVIVSVLSYSLSFGLFSNK